MRFIFNVICLLCTMVLGFMYLFHDQMNFLSDSSVRRVLMYLIATTFLITDLMCAIALIGMDINILKNKGVEN